MHSLKLFIVMGAALLCLPYEFAYAESYEDAQNTELRRELGDVEMYCKVKLEASIDFASFEEKLKQVKKDKAKGLGRHCKAGLKAVRNWCALGFEKSIGKEVTSYICKYDSKGETASLENGVLTVRTSWQDHYSAWEKAVKRETGKVLYEGEFNVARAVMIRADEEKLKSLMGDFTKHCEGHGLKWKVDWRSFAEKLDERAADSNLQRVWADCYAPLRAVELRCNNGQSDLVKEQVHSVICQYDENAQQSLILKDKTLTFTSNLLPSYQQELVNADFGDLLQDGEFTARQTDFIKDENAGFKRVFAEPFESVCGVELEWEIDWKSFQTEVEKRILKAETTSIYSACGVPVERMAAVCRKPKVAKKVRKKIKSFKCSYGGKRKRKLKLSRRQLSYKVDFGSKDSSGYADKFLVKKRIIKKRPPPKKYSSAELARIQRILGQGVSAKQQCKRNCSKNCRGRSNVSKCKSRCRAACR